MLLVDAEEALKQMFTFSHQHPIFQPWKSCYNPFDTVIPLSNISTFWKQKHYVFVPPIACSWLATFIADCPSSTSCLIPSPPCLPLLCARCTSQLLFLPCTLSSPWQWLWQYVGPTSNPKSKSSRKFFMITPALPKFVWQSQTSLVSTNSHFHFIGYMQRVYLASRAKHKVYKSFRRIC